MSPHLLAVCKLLCLVSVLGVRGGLALPSKRSGGREMHNGKYEKGQNEIIDEQAFLGEDGIT